MSTDAERLTEAAINMGKWAETAPTTDAPPPPGSPAVTADGLIALADALGKIISECQAALDYADETGPAHRLAKQIMRTLDAAL